MSFQSPSMRFSLLLVAALLGACGGGDGGSGPPPLATPAGPAAGTVGDGRLAELIEWARDSQQAPAMGAVIVRRGQVVELAAVGQRSANGGPSVTTNDKWHLGSITKSMTATLAALLVEDGIISWETKPLEVWPELANDVHANFRDVTLRQLLSHTSGMERDDEWSGSSNGAAGTTMEKRREWAARLLGKSPAGAAGQFAYSNMGYVVAGSMLESRAGIDWETLLAGRVFAPLGMTHSGFGAPGTAGLVDQPLGHLSSARGFQPVEVGSSADNVAALGPAGTVHVTLGDFALYLQAHLAGARGTPGLLSAQSFQTLHTAVAPGYALGWSVHSALPPFTGGGFSHNGSNLRWFAQAWFSPDEDAGVLVTVNGGGERAAAAITALDLLLRQRVDASP